MKPCLVIGSGFHSWVLGRPSTPLSNWDSLIDEVAAELKVSVPSNTLTPVLRWEKLLEIASSNGFQHPLDSTKWINKSTIAVSKIEPHAKNALKKVIQAHAVKYPYRSSRAQFPLEKAFASVISLNFDHCWLGQTNFIFGSQRQNVSSGGLTVSEVGRLRNYIQPMHENEKVVWFPNGSVVEPMTIRMGLYEYGAQAHALKSAFNLIKEFEKEAEKKLGTNDWMDLGPVLEEELSKNPLNQDIRLANWVAQFLYRPIFFAGVGLSQSETGLWWLLAQRARNFARVLPKQRPPTVVLMHAKNEQRALWANRPCGIEAMYCDNWDHGWEMLLERASPNSVDGGTF